MLCAVVVDDEAATLGVTSRSPDHLAFTGGSAELTERIAGSVWKPLSRRLSDA